MLRLLRLERRIARLEARAARRAAARRERAMWESGPRDPDDPREIILRRLDVLASLSEADDADAAGGWGSGWGVEAMAAGRHRAPGAAAWSEPAPVGGEGPSARSDAVAPAPPPAPGFPDAAAAPAAREPAAGAAQAAANAWRPPPRRPPARPCEAPGAVPCGLVCRLGGGADCRALARRGFAFAAPPGAPAGLAAGGG